ncbi:hypothetical protein [Rhizomonospora bruguierae]|uniref:hypothetical protein n=1 Tax=Rhizomonospora bruguierae TaxID=1581705 RepID=UPI001BCBD2BC|nr:hypothetical protein [Micromonospora sp. NBRC 107566]
MDPTETSPRARRVGGGLLWFAALGGALSWTVHLFVAWATDELACASGHTTLAGFPVKGVVTIGVVLPALVAAAALATAWLAWRRTSAAAGEDDPRMGRAALLAVVGLAANTLFLAIIIAGGVSLLVFSACQR